MNFIDKINIAFAEDRKMSNSEIAKIQPFLQDFVGKKTGWFECVVGASVYKRQQLEMTENILKYRFSLQGLSIRVIYILLVGSSIFDKLYLSEEFINAFFLIILLIWILYSTNEDILKCKTFDKTIQYFYIGTIPKFFETDGESIVPFNQIYALQIIAKEVWGKTKIKYIGYELNMVLKDGKRINLNDTRNLDVIRGDAEKISIFMQIPIWDVTKN